MWKTCLVRTSLGFAVEEVISQWNKLQFPFFPGKVLWKQLFQSHFSCGNARNHIRLLERNTHEPVGRQRIQYVPQCGIKTNSSRLLYKIYEPIDFLSKKILNRKNPNKRPELKHPQRNYTQNQTRNISSTIYARYVRALRPAKNIINKIKSGRI